MNNPPKSADYRLRQNNDPLHALQLLRDMAIVNERSVHELGPLPSGGLPVQPRRKPDLPRPPESLAVQEDEMNPLQRIAAATALAASTLAACGKAHPPEQSPESTPAAIPTPPAPNPPPVAAPEPATNVAEVEIKRGPAIPADVLRKQVLALLGSIQSLQDLERQHVEAIFNASATKEPKMRDGYRYEGKTTEGWNYGFSVSRLGPLSDPPDILIGFDHGVEPWTDQKPTYCTLDFEELARDIVALGYERGATLSTYGGKPSWGFGRRVPTTRTGFGVSVYLYYLNEGTESERTCVKGIDIGGSLRHE